MIRTRRALNHLMLAAALIISAPAYAQDAPDTPDAPTQPMVAKNIQPEADAVLKRMGELLSQTQSFRFDAHVAHDVALSAGLKIKLHQERTLTVSRPGKLHAVGDGDLDQSEVWFNEGALSAFDPTRNAYSQIEGPQDIDGILDHLALERGWVLPMADLVVSDPYTSATANVQLGIYLDQRNLRGTVCDHLAFRQEGIDWQIWIDAGETPVPRKLLITFTGLAGHPQWAVELDNWDLTPEIEDGQFDFVVPEGATPVQFDEFRRN